MNKLFIGSIIVLLALGLAALFVVYLPFRHDLRAARERVAAGGTVLETVCGAVEYAEEGDGPVALVIHGAGGGYDQGLLLGEIFLGNGYHLIAPSRFGYLNSSVPGEASVQAQADAYACLLDALGITKPLPVIAFSAGGPSAMQFAASYPERTSELVLVSAISFTGRTITAEEQQKESTINRIVSSNFVYWLAINAAPKTVIEVLGVSRDIQAGLLPHEQEQVTRVLEYQLPMDMRQDGIAVDQSYDLTRVEVLEQIGAPTLVFHCKDDSLISFENGQNSADRIAGAQLVAFETGGHFSIGNFEALQTRTLAFLRK